MLSQTTYAPGARVLIRDEEWMIRRAQPARSGSALHVLGLSELVRNQEAIFLTELDEVEVLQPEKTQLVRDESPGHRQARLYLEALLRRTPPTDHRLAIGHRAAIQPSPFQWEPAAKALKQLRPRILMADGVGLGKTIEVGVLLSELIRRGRGERILVVALKSILAQLQEELWARFTIPLVRLDSVGIQRVQGKIPSNQNPFHYFDKVIVSIDTLKREARYRRYLENAHWDVVVVDECQNVATRGSTASMRARLAQLLARTCDSLVFTSATPHDGRPESFASLMRLLEPTSISDVADYTKEDVEELFIRRFQKDVRGTSSDFLERDVGIIEPEATEAEDAALRAISQAQFRTIGRSRHTDALFRVLILKAWLSSPAACISTLAERRKKLDKLESKGKRSPEDIDHDREVIGRLSRVVRAVDLAEQSKLQALFAWLEGLGYGPGRAGQRVVLFSERIDTLEFLKTQLARRFGLTVTPRRKGEDWKKGEIAVFHGGLVDQDQYALVADFSNAHGTIRLLLGSDAASEGLNLHHACHHLIHYDIPWSLITMEQRNGRIDRYGQTDAPIIRYLLTRPGDPELRGDARIIKRLIEKETEAAKNLGDVAWLMNLHEARKEEARIARAIEEGEDSDAPFVAAEGDEAGEDWLMDLLSEGVREDEPVQTLAPLTLFERDLDYAREALAQVDLRVDWLEGTEGFRLKAPEDLLYRYRYLPPELQRDRSGEFKLSTDRQRVMDAYARARDTEEGWPEWELFWEQHPIAQWLNDRVLASFRRHEAPVVELSAGLQPGEAAFVFQSTLSNHRSQPVLVEWSAVLRQVLGTLVQVELDTLLDRCGLTRALPNSGRDLDTAPLEASLIAAVALVRRHLDSQRRDYERRAAAALRPEVRKLRRWMADSKDRLAHRQETMLIQRADQVRRIEHERAELDATYEARKRWIEDTIKVSPTPFIRLAAVLVRPA